MISQTSTFITAGISGLLHRESALAQSARLVRVIPAWMVFDDEWWRVVTPSFVLDASCVHDVTVDLVAPGKSRQEVIHCSDLPVESKQDVIDRCEHDIWRLWEYCEKRFTAHATMHASILHSRACAAYAARIRIEAPGTFDPQQFEGLLWRRWLGDDEHEGRLIALRDRLMTSEPFARVDPVKYVNDWLHREATDTVWSLARMSSRMRPYVSELRRRDGDIRETYRALMASGASERGVLAALNPYVEAFSRPLPLSAVPEREVSHEPGQSS